LATSRRSTGDDVCGTVDTARAVAVYINGRWSQVSLVRVVAVISVLVAVTGAVGCGSSTKTVSETAANGQVTTQTVPNIHFAKTKFLLHMGLAFGAFHRYIYKPLRAGAFKSGASGRVRAVLKAAAAALFAVHELKVAHEDALSDSHLRPIANKIDALAGKLGGLGSALKGGVSNPAAILGSAGAVDALGAASGGLGVAVKDLAPAIGG
jgi:hypothetical protein